MKIFNPTQYIIGAGGLVFPPQQTTDTSQYSLTPDQVKDIANKVSANILQVDVSNNWLNALGDGWDYKFFRPLTLTAAASSLDTTTTPQVGVSAPSSAGGKGITIGNPGAAGDYLEELQISVLNSSGNSQVLLQDNVGALTYDSGGNSAWVGLTSFNFGKTTSSLPAVSNWINSYLVGSYQISTYGAAVLPRKITNLTVGNPTALTIESLAVSDPAGSAINPTAIYTPGSYLFTIQELITACPRGVTSVGTLTVKVQSKSKYGPWRIFVDSAVSVLAIGNFS